MKRIIYSCILVTLIFLSKNIVAQPFTATVSPTQQCYSASGNSLVAGVQFTAATAVSYTWTVVSPSTGSASQTLVVPGGTLTTFYFTGCGVFTITCLASNGAPGFFDSRFIYPVVECPTSATISSVAGAGLSPSICAGSTATLNASGGATYTWTPSNFSGASFTTAPAASSCYTVNGNTAIGCTIQPAVGCVTVQAVNLNLIPPSQTVCPTTTVVLNATTAGTPVASPITYQWVSFPPTPLNPTQTQTVVVGAVGTVTVFTVTATINTCSVQATNTITSAPFLSILAAANVPSICVGGTIALTATSSATSYTWTGQLTTNPTYSATGNPTTAVGPGTYIVVGTNGACTGTAAVAVGVNNFTPTIVSSPTAVCAGETFTMIASGGTANSYTWGVISTLPPTPICLACTGTVTTSQTNSTTYGVGAQTAAGCLGSVSIQVGMLPDLTVTLTASSPSVCASSPVTLTAVGNGSLYTFVSSTSGPISPSSTTTVVVDNPTSATIYTVFVTNATGYCTGQSTVAVGMSTGSLNIITAASVATICPGQSSNLTASGAINYVWSPANTLSAPNASTTVASPTVTTTYTVVGDNNGGCTGSSTITVYAGAIPNVTVSATANAVCAGYTSTLSAFGAVSYTWTGNSFSIPVYQSSVSVSPPPGQPGVTVGNYTVIGSSAAGCISAPAYFNVALSSPLLITTSITPSQGTTCISQNYPIKLSKPLDLFVAGASTYVWFPYNPAYMTYSLGPQTTVRPPTSTCYTITGNTSVCSGTAIICVTVQPQFTVVVTPPLPAICFGDSIRLSVTSISTLAIGSATPGLPNSLLYEWYDPPTSPPPSLAPGYTSKTVTAFPSITSTYTLQVTDVRSCISVPRLITVTVLPQPLLSTRIPTINNVPTNTVCFVGDLPGAPDVTLFLEANISSNNLPFGVTPTYTWVSPHVPSSVVTPANSAGVQIVAPKRLPAVVVYTVNGGYNGIPGCKASDTITVRIIDCRRVLSSRLTFDTDVQKTDTLCARDCITYIATTDTTAGGPQTYTWTFQGGSPPVSHERSPVVCYDLPNKDGWNVTLAVGNPYPVYDNPPGSIGTKAFYQSVKVVDYPNVTIIPPGQRASDTTVKFGQSVVLTATNASNYVWSPAYAINTTKGNKVTVNPTRTTQYIVRGYSSRNCYSTDTINVNVLEDCGDMFVPNAFSPNGDGINDELIVNGVCLETLTFMIFNRWGEKVFETNDVTVGWDGTFHGDKLNTGVFVYRLEGKSYDGKGFSSKGNITLIR